MSSTITQKLIGICICIIFLVTGCSGTNQQSSSPSVIPLAASATSTLNPISTSTLNPISTSTPTEISPTASPAVIANGSFSVQDTATFVEENYPDNSIFTPGQTLVKTWEIKNTGSLTWSTAYQLILFASPQGDSLSSPSQINFPQETAPGKTVSLSLPLVAPVTPGTYSVYWAIRNERGEMVAVDGGNLWVKIQVCKTVQSCNTPVAGGGTTATVNNTSVTVTNFTYDAHSATVNYCIAISSLSDWKSLRAYGSWPTAPKLLIDQKAAPFLAGGSDYPSGDGCAYMQYQVGASEIDQAQQVTFVIEALRMDLPPGDPDAVCQMARSNLVTQYPGLDFKCNFSMAGFYTDLQIPNGMSRNQAETIVMDAIQGAIYGPWTLFLK
ncbi:MAG: NBR1-Ig-like domain-containing protein [Anaerolineaceae bacterium]